jgi:hypothetical protein
VQEESEDQEDPLALLYHVIVNPPAIKELRFYARYVNMLAHELG